MRNPSHWKQAFEQEIKLAEAARMRGNEGMARVCARRAAGIAAGEFFRRQGMDCRTASAYARLKLLQEYAPLSPQIRAVAGHFLLRLTPEYELPISVDLVSEARWLLDALLSLPTAQPEDIESARHFTNQTDQPGDD